MTKIAKIKKKFKKISRAASPPSKEFTAPTAKLRDYVFEHGTSKAVASNIKVTKALSKYVVTMMTSTMSRFRESLMTLLVEPDMKEPPMPVAWEHKTDDHREVVTTSNKVPKWVDKNSTLFGVEVTLYTDITVNRIQGMVSGPETTFQ